MLDIQLLQLVSTDTGWDRYADLVIPSTQEGSIILEDMGEYRAAAGGFSWDGFVTWFFSAKHPTMKSEKMDIYREVFSRLMNAGEMDEGQRTALLNAMNERYYANEIRKVAEAIQDGRRQDGLGTIADLITRANDDSTLLLGEDKHVVTADLEDIVEALSPSHGLSWRLPEFNQSLGSTHRGDLILFSARPESGKTTLLASETSWFAQQCKDHPDFKDRPIVWFNNEEEGKKVKFRIMQAALGATTKRIMNDPNGAKRKYADIVGHPDRIIVYDNKRMHWKEIEKFLAKHNPCVIVYDQLRKVGGFEKEGSEVMRLQQLYGKHARAMAAEYGTVLTVHQARGDAEGQKWLFSNQLEGSQTEVQGELDAQIMMGRSHEAGEECVRGIHIVKNKLIGGKDAQESLRHGKFEVIIKPEIGRLVSPLEK